MLRIAFVLLSSALFLLDVGTASAGAGSAARDHRDGVSPTGRERPRPRDVSNAPGGVTVTTTNPRRPKGPYGYPETRDHRGKPQAYRPPR
jgi:hypothetical protein